MSSRVDILPVYEMRLSRMLILHLITGIGFYRHTYCTKGIIMERSEIIIPSERESFSRARVINTIMLLFQCIFWSAVQPSVRDGREREKKEEKEKNKG